MAALTTDIPPAPEQQAAIVAANRSGRPRAEVRMTPAPVRLGLRENAAQFSLLVAINAFVGMMVGLERSTLPLVGRRRLPPRLQRRCPVVHRRLRPGEGVHEPRRRRPGPASRAAAGC